MKFSGVIFLVIALVHLWRIVNGIPIAFGTSFVPMWLSWVGVLVGGYLSFVALKKKV